MPRVCDSGYSGTQPKDINIHAARAHTQTHIWMTEHEHTAEEQAEEA